MTVSVVVLVGVVITVDLVDGNNTVARHNATDSVITLIVEGW